MVIQFYEILTENSLQFWFPNVETMLRQGRTFDFTLKHITMGQKHLTDHIVMNIESDYLYIDMDTVISEFIYIKSRKFFLEMCTYILNPIL